MELHLRKATENDLQTVLDILNHGTRSKIRRGDLAWGMSDHDPESVKQIIDQGMFYLAISGEAIVGTCALSWQDAHMWGNQPPIAGYIQRFASAPGYSGQGAGGKIMDLLVEEIAKAGRQCLRIAVPSNNIKLRAYYEAHGFTRADDRIIPPTHPSYSAAYYERQVSGSIQPQQTTQRQGFFSKLKHSKIFRDSE